MWGLSQLFPHLPLLSSGYDPLNLGADPVKLKWFREAELQHCRWAMLGVAGILGQELFNPSVFFYDAATKASLPFDILGLAAFQFLTMHFVVRCHSAHPGPLTIAC